MATQGAVQLEVTILGQSFSIDKKYLSSLRVKRVLGDGANEFTLELFDETAYEVEALLSNTMLITGGDFADIYVRYSAANDFGSGSDESKKSVVFTGVIYDYQMTLVGMSTMLSLEGLLSAAGTSAASTFWWFDKSTICWCGTQEYYHDDDGYTGDPKDRPLYVDGKSPDQYNQWESNRDVCAIVEYVDGTPVVKVNPSRVFERIIHKYNGDRLGFDAGAGWGEGGSGLFNVGKVDPSEWIEGVDCIQRDETAAQFINRCLCKTAVQSKGNGKYIAGFQYFVDGNGHNFIPLNYTEQDLAKTITIRYGYKDSNIISFSLANVGPLVMSGGMMEKSQINSIDLMYGEQCDNFIIKEKTTIDQSTGTRADQNWWNVNVSPVKINSVSNGSLLKAINQNTFKAVEDAVMEASLTIWGEYSNDITPGKFIDLTINTLNNKRHYASGIYYIVEVVDEISSAGYLQTLTLIKNTGKVYKNDTVEDVKNVETSTTKETSGTARYSVEQVTSYPEKLTNSFEKYYGVNNGVPITKPKPLVPIK